jgi:hypothetical protein
MIPIIGLNEVQPILTQWTESRDAVRGIVTAIFRGLFSDTDRPILLVMDYVCRERPIFVYNPPPSMLQEDPPTRLVSPGWLQTPMQQITGRAIRSTSHADLHRTC